MRKRILIILAIFIANILFLVYRLFAIGVINSDQMLQKASMQRMSGVSINNLRGNIFDRNLIPLTNNDEKTCIVIIPQLIEEPENAAKIISQSINIQYEEVLKSIKLKKPFEYKVDYDKGIYIKNQITSGIYITKTNSRYGESSIARHVIGYVNVDNIGQYGVEKGFNEYLKRAGHQEVGILTDSLKRPLDFGIKAVDSNYKNNNSNLKLTIDYHFQNIIEKLFDKYSYNGACVLLDSTNGDVLAMVSRPNFEQNDVVKCFGSSNKELINKTLYPYNLGSIFKIVIAEAAYERGIVKENDVFSCPGYINVDGQVIKCASFNSGGHGQISFENAFSASCNTAFINVGLKLGYKNIIEYARKFGLGQSLGFDVYGFNEDPGLIPYKSYTSSREIANLSIGQGEILVTPLQVANLINIVANNGTRKQINIVDSIVDDNGRIIKKIRNEEKQVIFFKENIQKVKKMMAKVIKEGTGVRANMDELGGAAGKTSSAETGIYKDGEQIVHAWFGGYFPETNPKYVLSIVIENGKTGSQVAAPLFGEIASEILKTGR